jgi:hypothetical protein
VLFGWYVVSNNLAPFHAHVIKILLAWGAITEGLKPIGISLLANLSASIDSRFNRKLIVKFVMLKEDSVLNPAL